MSSTDALFSDLTADMHVTEFSPANPDTPVTGTDLLSDKALARLNAMGWRPDAIQQHPLNSKADVDDMFRKGEQAIEAFRAINGAGDQTWALNYLKVGHDPLTLSTDEAKELLKNNTRGIGIKNMMTLFSEYGVSPAMSKKFRWNQFDELVQRIVEKVKAGQAEIPMVPDYTLTNPINNTFLHLEPLSNNTNAPVASTPELDTSLDGVPALAMDMLMFHAGQAGSSRQQQHARTQSAPANVPRPVNHTIKDVREAHPVLSSGD
ncbi:hypothetical protein WJX74_006834 [Apatococcus lobatus]|uniref:Uncharacterized protein n=1 Tax=Apatococcus lobatus TaxID=904363 RepID=A0AAW1RTH3_9CHLO